MTGKILQIVYLMVISLGFCSQALAIIQTENGYQLQFNYTDYPKEQEIAYQYYLEKFQKMPDIPKENIGVDMFDIDGDGIQEIFLFANGNKDGEQYCPRCGCPFAVIKPTNDEKKYIAIPFFIKAGVTSFLNEGGDPKILYSLTNGWHDILIGEQSDLMSIYFWNGKFYEDKTIEKDYKFKTVDNKR